MKLLRLREGPAWLVWVLYAALVVTLMAGAPNARSVAAGYFDTAEAWWSAERDIYTAGIAGYLYPPQSLYLFTPFTWFPSDIGHALWRLFGLALLAVGLRRAAAHLPGERGGEMFALATLLVISASIGATKTGQSNLHLAGCMLLAASALASARWWPATLWLGLGLFMKPLAVVPILLASWIYRPAVMARFAPFLLGFLLLPFAHPDTAYASTQYAASMTKIARASQPGDKVYADLVGLLRTVGIDLMQAARSVLGAVAAIATLWLSMRGTRRGRGPILLMALAASYLMLCNPRTETNSYVILVPYVAFAAGVAWLVRDRRGWAVVGVVACVLLGCDNYGRGLHEATNPWLKPLIALLFTGVLVRMALRAPEGDGS